MKLGIGAGAAAAAAMSLGAYGAWREGDRKTVARLTIAPFDIELAPGICVRTIAFNATMPGPALECNSLTTSLDVHNASGSDIVLHSPALAEPLIPIRAHARAQALLRKYNGELTGANLKPYYAYCASGAIAAGVMKVGTGSEGNIGECDQSQVLSIHRWGPRLVARASPFDDTVIAHRHASFNDKLMSASEPIKVGYGDRVHFHFSNTSTTQGVTLGLPRHRFAIAALDGHRVATPRHVEKIHLGPAETIDAFVTMDCPGRWVLGATHREDRLAGLGRLVEYKGASGPPVAGEYGTADWDYGRFGAADSVGSGSATPLPSIRALRPVASTEPPLFNPAPQVTATPLGLSVGKRYLWTAANFTRDPQSLQLLEHNVNLIGVAGRRIAAVRKDTVTLPSYTRIEFEFVARTRQVVLAHDRRVTLELS